MARRQHRRAHGQGSVYRRGPDNWAVSWREHGRRRYAGGFETRELAEQVRAKITGDIAAGRAGLPRDPKSVPTLAELAGPWLERRRATHRAAADDAGRWRLHLAPHLGACRPAEVDAAATNLAISISCARSSAG
ncbi:MAG: hypothetical protein HY744_13280 [Deltaproteobacteria bacterium]|nr:hypothetical protein [Deltaproteobacteria bacterium]